ncbi:MAG: hypothetical protein PHZ09_13090 [Eubacteriales bacterium]|nr:hypothetical protein [Eubacteriales bacterium]
MKIKFPTLPMRAVSFFMAALVVSVSLSACLNETETADTGTVPAETDAVTDSLGARGAVEDGLAEYDFEGTALRAIVQDSCAYDFWTEAETGDALDDSIYYRNRAVEERFNVDIADPQVEPYSNISTVIRGSVNAGDDEFDLVLGQMEMTGADALSGIFLNWYEIPYLDFSRPWYPKSIIDNAATVNNRMFSLMSDMLLSYAQQTWCIVFDKADAASYNLPDVYDLVRGGTWTLDKLTEITKDICADLDGDNTADEDDYYGFVSGMNGCLLLSFFYAADQHLVEITEDYEIDHVINSEKAAALVDKLRRLHFESPGSLSVADSSNSGIYTKFIQRQALFCPIQLQYTYSQLRDYENDYGMVPFPKYDDAQAEYYATCDAGSNVISIPMTAVNYDLIGICVEALSSYGWKNVLPVYYDICMDMKSARDEESIEMLDMILDNRYVDFASLYNGWNGWVFSLPQFVSGDGAFASTYESLVKAKTAYYESILEVFLG